MTTLRRLLCITMICAVSFSAMAWGPRTQLGIVSTAMHIISRDGYVPLTKLNKEIQAGASVSQSEIEYLYPNLRTYAVDAIEAEMYLLQAVRRSRVDVYFAYRLGALGQLVANTTSPVHGINSIHKNSYFSDVDRVVDQISLKVSRPKSIEPEAYFAMIASSMVGRGEMIIMDYQSGIGFNGIAKTSYSDDVCRSIEAVRNVWYSILLGNTAVTNVSNGQIRDYVASAMEYYVKRGNQNEIDGAYARLVLPDIANTQFYKRLGDLYYDAGEYPRAMKEYHKVLEAEPNRRDVIKRLSEYYVLLGDESLEAMQLELALTNYRMAVEVNKLHPMAQRKVLQTEDLIVARDKRFEEADNARIAAEDFEIEADRYALEKNYAKAIALLKQAESKYFEVTDEFLALAATAETGLRNVGYRIRQLKDELIDNAQTLSGKGFINDARRMVADVTDVDRQALHSIVASEYEVKSSELASQMRRRLEAPF